MNNQSPPQLPPGWIALWDESSQRYYYVEQATGTTQWEVPTSQFNAAEAGVVGRGEASSYSVTPQGQGGYTQQSGFTQQGGYAQQGGYPQQGGGYPQQDSYSQQGSGYPQKDSSYPQQNPQQGNGYPVTGQQAQTGDGPDGERGMGKMLSGFGGGALTGTLIGFAAGKLLGNHHHQQSGGFAQQFGNFGPPQGQGYYPPPQNYGPPPKKHHFW